MTEAELIARLEQRGCENVRANGSAVSFNRGGNWHHYGVVGDKSLGEAREMLLREAVG